MWTVTLSEDALKDIKRLSRDQQIRIMAYIRDRIPQNPIHFSKRLMGPLSSFYRFRVGDYRLLAEITPETHNVLIVHIGHRREVYRDEG